MIAIGFFMLPYMLHSLGEDTYGLWILVSSIIAAFYVFDLGFANTITVFLSKSFSKKDAVAVNQTISTAFLIYCTLACVIFLASVIVALSVPYWAEKKELVRLMQILILITGGSLALEFPFKAFAGVAVAFYRFDLVSYSRLTFRLIGAGITILLIEKGFGLIGIAWGYFFVAGVSNFVFYWIARSVYGEMRVSISLVSRGVVKELLNFSLWTFVIDTAQILKGKIDIFIVGIFMSTTTLATYYVAVRLAESAIQFATHATSLSLPVFSKYQAQNNVQQLKRGVILFSRVNAMVGSLMLIGLGLLGLSFIKLWIGPEHDSALSYQCMITLLIGRFLFYQAAPSAAYLYVSGGHRYLAIVGIIEAVFAIALTYFLVRHTALGLFGAAIGMGAGNFLSRATVLMWVACQKIDYSITRLYRHLAPIAIFAIVLVSGSLMLPESVRSPETYIELVAYSLILGAAFVGGILFLLSNDERNIVAGVLPEKIAKLLWVRHNK